VRQVRHTDLVPNVEHLRARLAAPAPLEPIFNAVRLYIPSPSYLLDPHARGGEEGVLTPRKRFDENSKLQQQELLGMLSTTLDKALEKALKAVFPSMFEGLSGMRMRGLDRSSGLSGSSGQSEERALSCTMNSTLMLKTQVMNALSSSSTSNPCASSSQATFASSTSSSSFASTSIPPAASHAIISNRPCHRIHYYSLNNYHIHCHIRYHALT
jgi:hypothetical protein